MPRSALLTSISSWYTGVFDRCWRAGVVVYTRSLFRCTGSSGRKSSWLVSGLVSHVTGFRLGPIGRTWTDVHCTENQLDNLYFSVDNRAVVVRLVATSWVSEMKQPRMNRCNRPPRVGRATTPLSLGLWSRLSDTRPVVPWGFFSWKGVGHVDRSTRVHGGFPPSECCNQPSNRGQGGCG